MKIGRFAFGRGFAASLAATGILAAGALPAQALDTFLVGPRAMGMAGANVASTSDTTAQYYNPAAFGFFGCRDDKGARIACDNNDLGRKKWGGDLNASGGYRLHKEFGNFVDDLADIDRDILSANSVRNESDLVDLIDLVKSLDGLDEPGNAITATVNAGLGVRYGHFAMGGRGFAQASGLVVELDSANLGLSGSTDLNGEINAISLSGNDFQTSLFTADQQAQLAATGLDADAIQRLDFLARRQGVSGADNQGFVDLMAGLSAQTISGTSGTLENNTTTVLLTGFALGEVPLSYGYALGNHWSVGGNLKLMVGRVYGNEIVVFDNGSEDILKNSDEEYEETFNVGVDLGIMGRYRFVNLGVVARNLNAPSFDGPTVNGAKFDDVKVDPQVTAGIAFIPYENLTLEVDYDLTENETTLTGYDTRNLAFGLEWDAFRAVALRAGAYKNLAEDDIGWAYTGGLGFNLWAARLEVAGALAGEKVEYDGDKVPKEVQVAAQLSVDF